MLFGNGTGVNGVEEKKKRMIKNAGFVLNKAWKNSIFGVII